MSEWQPIETAPKHGDLIVLLDRGRARVGYWGGSELGWRVSIPHSKTAKEPTHWLPLPELPNER